MTATTTTRRRQAHRVSAGEKDSADESQAASIEAMEQEATRRQDLVESYLELASLMYFGTPQPFSEILRDRQEPDDLKGRNRVDEAFIENMVGVPAKLVKKDDKNNKERNAPVYTPLDVLLSAMREPEVIDDWSPHEIAIFMAAIAHHGEVASAIAPYLPSKSVSGIEDFLDQVYKRTKYCKPA
jgi:hypothetical protein